MKFEKLPVYFTSPSRDPFQNSLDISEKHILFSELFSDYEDILHLTEKELPPLFMEARTFLWMYSTFRQEFTWSTPYIRSSSDILYLISFAKKINDASLINLSLSWYERVCSLPQQAVIDFSHESHFHKRSDAQKITDIIWDSHLKKYFNEDNDLLSRALGYFEENHCFTICNSITEYNAFLVKVVDQMSVNTYRKYAGHYYSSCNEHNRFYYSEFLPLEPKGLVNVSKIYSSGTPMLEITYSDASEIVDKQSGNVISKKSAMTVIPQLKLSYRDSRMWVVDLTDMSITRNRSNIFKLGGGINLKDVAKK